MQVVGDAGGVRAEGDGAKYSYKPGKGDGMVSSGGPATDTANARRALGKIRPTDEAITPNSQRIYKFL